ncbi:hypothetical protein CC78DRAFT_470723 [Lojkania enalia]|uniref:Uncharacterized protein n=1 Tax=Lojkania enalia TaxID=147567 RepID=A0A9P4K3L5_9PLEO|nr:hypothetical protein CC78DRAFT_470723 [Didymosphaeria enalia]
MSSSWLQRKRKGELIELAQRANLPDAESLLKDDLVELLYEHLESNESTYGKQSDFRDFYKRTGSPVKRDRGSPSEALAVTKTRRRTTSKLLENADSEEPTPDKALVARTPRTISSRVASRVSNVDLPASPAQVAELADQSFQAAKTKASELWQKTYIDEFIEIVRENASSVVVIQLLLLFVEGAGLEWNTLETINVEIPKQTQLPDEYRNLPLPNMQLLLTSGFWAPAMLWSLTSWMLPLAASYFFNLTLRSNTRHKSLSKQYHVDPLTFNIVKALLAYSAFGAPAKAWGPFSKYTVHTVASSVPGEYPGLLISAAVGMLVSLYDAALKK